METFIEVSNILHIISSLPLLALIISAGGSIKWQVNK